MGRGQRQRTRCVGDGFHRPEHCYRQPGYRYAMDPQRHQAAVSWVERRDRRPQLQLARLRPHGGGACGPNAAAPCDDQGHGTHTTGTTAGSDGGANQVGVAPGAKWIGCRNMDQGAAHPLHIPSASSSSSHQPT